jgi:hypothetical protein
MAGKTGQNKVRKQAANDFLIWRVGNSVGWDCTLADLAGETGLHIKQWEQHAGGEAGSRSTAAQRTTKTA